MKINDQIFIYIQKKKPLVHFPNVWSKKIFYKNSGSVTYNCIRVSSTIPKFREI